MSKSWYVLASKQFENVFAWNRIRDAAWAADRILQRGGTVVLLYMAGCGARREFEERLFPRAQYWDPLAHGTHAIAIATEDYPALSQFDCFDGSHIDAADSRAWATALGWVILAARARRS